MRRPLGYEAALAAVIRSKRMLTDSNTMLHHIPIIKYNYNRILYW